MLEFIYLPFQKDKKNLLIGYGLSELKGFLIEFFLLPWDLPPQKKKLTYAYFNGAFKMKYLSLFSGIGGFEYGIQQSKYSEHFECIGFSEIDKYAKSIYIRHFPEHKDLGDATKIRTENLPDFDFLVGGFPCQAFSVAGKRRGFDDTRGTLFFEIARILKDKRPRYFLLENVKGLLSHDKGKTFQTILKVLSDLGYVVQWTLLNSKDFQVPQRRERVFIEGYFGRKCAGEVLSVRRNCEKDSPPVSKTMYGTRQGRVHYPDEHMNTLTASGHNGGGVKSLSNPNAPKIKERESNSSKAQIKKVGNFSPTGHYGKNVYDSEGLCPTLCSGSVVKNGLNIREVKRIGSLNGHQSGNVYESDGLSPGLCATDYKAPVKIIERDKNER